MSRFARAVPHAQTVARILMYRLCSVYQTPSLCFLCFPTLGYSGASLSRHGFRLSSRQGFFLETACGSFAASEKENIYWLCKGDLHIDSLSKHSCPHRLFPEQALVFDCAALVLCVAATMASRHVRWRCKCSLSFAHLKIRKSGSRGILTVLGIM